MAEEVPPDGVDIPEEMKEEEGSVENGEASPGDEEMSNENQENPTETAEDGEANENLFDDDSESDEEVVVTIGDIKTNLPLQRRGFPVQKLDPNVTPNVQGKNIFEVNPTEFDERPWLKSGANIADYFNFGFNEETWNEYAEKQRLLRLEYPSQAEVNRIIMDELREKHGNKDAGVPIVLPVQNVGGRNLVTIQSVESKPPVKIGFPTQNNIPINPSAAENLPPMIRNLVTGLTPAPQSHQSPSVIPTVNLTTPTVAPESISPPKPMVVDLTKLPPTKPMVVDLTKPPPMFTPRPTMVVDLTKPPPSFPPNFNRPPIGNYYGNMGMMGSGAVNMNTPPPNMLRQDSNEGPPGISASRTTSMEEPPGTEVDNMYRSNRRDREEEGPPGTETEVYRSERRDRDRGRERRRGSDGSDDDRRSSRRRYDRDRERERDDKSDQSKSRRHRRSTSRTPERSTRKRRRRSRSRSHSPRRERRY